MKETIMGKVMINRRLIWSVCVLLVVFCACSQDYSRREHSVYSGKEARISKTAGLQFGKVFPEPFSFNDVYNGRPVDGAVTNRYEVVEPDFFITKAPVPLQWFEQLSGKSFKKGLSYDDAQSVLEKAYRKTGIPYMIPTESMFEAAVASRIIDPEKSQQFVLSDGWDENGLNARSIVCSRMIPVTESKVVMRSLYERKSIERFRRRQDNGFYLAVRTGSGIPKSTLTSFDYRKSSPFTVSESDKYFDSKKETIRVGDVSFDMVPVTGGSRLVGATAAQARYAEKDEGPERSVVVRNFKIGATEVTVGLWQTVMGCVPVGNDVKFPNRAVCNVSWYDCQEFITRLNRVTGKGFRLPSEDEWEYAARGGEKGKDYVFSGGNSVADYVVCTEKAESGKHAGENVRMKYVDVASKKPNALGIYDMSGNVWEWVRGSYPDGQAVMRGGSRLSSANACRVSNRQAMDPRQKKDTFGFRLAL